MTEPVKIVVGEFYKVTNLEIFEDIILVTEISPTNYVSYTVVETKGPGDAIKLYAGVFSNFGIGSNYHFGLESLEVWKAKQDFQQDVEDLLNEDL